MPLFKGRNGSALHFYLDNGLPCLVSDNFDVVIEDLKCDLLHKEAKSLYEAIMEAEPVIEN